MAAPADQGHAFRRVGERYGFKIFEPVSTDQHANLRDRDLCGRLSVGITKALIRRLAMLRGPIRRRPYNRGKIIAMKRQELIVLSDFYSVRSQAMRN
jgi:hypothetical protein